MLGADVPGGCPPGEDSDHPALSTSGFLNTTVGYLEAYACLSCGLVEWYVKDVRELDPSKMKGAAVKRS